MKTKFITFYLVLFLVAFFQKTISQTSNLVSVDSNGKLVYTPDSRGNIVPDFSAVGYMNSETPIPTVAVVKTLTAVAGDNTTNIQNAINEVSALTPDANGFRGAILFKAGTYDIGNSLNISASGIVLRGEGFDGTGTNFVATKTTKYNLINFTGASGTTIVSGTTKAITDTYVPIGKKQVTVAPGHSFAVGDAVFVHRIPNDAWIQLLGMDKLTLINPSDLTIVNWTADEYDLFSQRKITAVNGNLLTLDAPIMDIIDPVYSTGELMKYVDPRIQKCGIENMRISSNYSSDTDENHGWNAVSFNKIYNSWARNLEVYYFGYSAVNIYSGASFITVDNCKMLDPKSIIEGGRRYSFNVDGQRNLVQNCTTRGGRHDYVTGVKTCGPNVFYNCTATIQYSDIGPHHRWSTGILFDNIEGSYHQNVQNRRNIGSGHGWSGGQIMFWNCTAAQMIVQDPPGDQRNWAIGCKSVITNRGYWVYESIGTIESNGTFIATIPSLFQAQLNDRLSSLTTTTWNYAQVGIGTNTPNSSSILEVKSGSKGFLPPRMSYQQKLAIASPAAGLLIWCRNCGSNGEMQIYNGTEWTNTNGSPGLAEVPEASFTIESATQNSNSFHIGRTMSASDYITVAINVTSPGTIKFTTNTVNGYSFSNSYNGVYNAGIQNVILYATGTQSAYNSAGDNFTITGLGATSISSNITINNVRLGQQFTNHFNGIVGGVHNTTTPTDPTYYLKTSYSTGETFSSNGTCTSKPISTSACVGASITVGSNTYSIKDINGQCWMTEDLKELPNGVAINATQWLATPTSDQGYYGYYNATTASGAAGWLTTPSLTGEGLLYQWSAAMLGSTAERAKGVCPPGWHIPSDCEYLYLEHGLGLSIFQQNLSSGLRGETNDQGLLTSKLLSIISTIPTSTNSSGFSVYLNGQRFKENGSFIERNSLNYLITSTQSGTFYISRLIRNIWKNPVRRNEPKSNGQSVRCLKD